MPQTKGVKTTVVIMITAASSNKRTLTADKRQTYGLYRVTGQDGQAYHQ